MKIEDIQIKDMGKYRSVWMGIAMIWVVFFHSKLHIENSILAFVKKQDMAELIFLCLQQVWAVIILI